MVYISPERLRDETDVVLRWLEKSAPNSQRARPQRLAALNRANEIKGLRVSLHREIAALPSREGQLRVAEILDDPPDWICKVEIGDLLDWITRFGRHRIDRLCGKAGIWSAAHIGGPYSSVPTLTARQRGKLAALLRIGAGVAPDA